MAAFLDQSAATKADVELAVERAKSELIRWVASLVIGASVTQTIIVALLLKYLR